MDASCNYSLAVGWGYGFIRKIYWWEDSCPNSFVCFLAGLSSPSMGNFQILLFHFFSVVFLLFLAFQYHLMLSYSRWTWLCPILKLFLFFLFSQLDNFYLLINFTVSSIISKLLLIPSDTISISDTALFMSYLILLPGSFWSFYFFSSANIFFKKHVTSTLPYTTLSTVITDALYSLSLSFSFRFYWLAFLLCTIYIFLLILMASNFAAYSGH